MNPDQQNINASQSIQPSPQNFSARTEYQLWTSTGGALGPACLEPAILSLGVDSLTLTRNDGQILVSAQYQELAIELFGVAGFTLYHNDQVISVYCIKEGLNYGRTLLLKLVAAGLICGGVVLALGFLYGLGLLVSALAAIGTVLLIGILLNHLRRIAPAIMVKGNKSEIDKTSRLSAQMLERGVRRSDFQLQKLSQVGDKQFRGIDRGTYLLSLGMGTLLAGISYTGFFLNKLGGSEGYVGLVLAFAWLIASVLVIHKKFYKKAISLGWMPYETLNKSHVEIVNSMADRALEKVNPELKNINPGSIKADAVNLSKGLTKSYIQNVVAGWFNFFIMILLIMPPLLLWWISNLTDNF